MLQLLNRGHNVTGIDCVENQWSETVNENTITVDLREDNWESELPPDIDLIVHLAANARVYKLIENPGQARDNFITTFNILEFARNAGANVIFGSSREVYGNREKIIHDETETYVDECESPYTASKVGGEALVKSYGNCYDIQTTILRFSNVYGRYDMSDRVVPLFIAQAAHGQTLTVFGANKILDFTYIDDCVDGIITSIENFHKVSDETFNIASGEGSSLVEVAEIICETLDSDSSIEISSSRPGEVTRYIADTSKANRMVGYSANYDLQAGIEETIQWYEERDLYEAILEANDW
jgi:UDP-glucose 4-epimerase